MKHSVMVGMGPMICKAPPSPSLPITPTSAVPPSLSPATTDAMPEVRKYPYGGISPGQERRVRTGSAISLEWERRMLREPETSACRNICEGPG